MQQKGALDDLSHSLHPLYLAVIHPKRIKKLITVEPKIPIRWVNFECVNFLVNILSMRSLVGRQHIGRIMCRFKKPWRFKNGQQTKRRFHEIFAKVWSLLHCLPSSVEGAKTSEN